MKQVHVKQLSQTTHCLLLTHNEPSPRVLLDSGASISLVRSPQILHRFTTTTPTTIEAANGANMNTLGQGQLPYNLGPAVASSQLHDSLDVVLSIPELQKRGYQVYFPSYGGVILANNDSEVIYEGSSPHCNLADLSQLTDTYLQVHTSDTPPTSRPALILPIGTPTQWKRAAQSVQDAHQRQTLVNFAHKLTHDTHEVMIQRAKSLGIN